MEFSSTQVTYLDALGIDLWVPRDQLALSEPQIEESPQVDVRAAARAAVASAPETATIQSQPAQQTPPPSPVAQNQIPKIDMSAAPPSVVATAAPATESTVSAVPHFHLQFWCYGSGLWLVSSHQSLQPDHHKFVHNLAAYIQGKKRRPKHVGVFSWPMIDAPNIDQSESVAKSYLQQHIQQLQKISTMEKVIALDESLKWLPQGAAVGIDTDLDLCLQSVTEKQRVWHALQTHRLG